MPADRIKGVKRLSLIVGIFLGLVAAVFAEIRTPWSRFLEQEAFHFARQKEFPNRDLSYQSMSNPPKWEDTVSDSSYVKELNSLLEAAPRQRLQLRLKYQSIYGLLPFAITAIIAWTFGRVALWIYKGFQEGI